MDITVHSCGQRRRIQVAPNDTLHYRKGYVLWSCRKRKSPTVHIPVALWEPQLSYKMSKFVLQDSGVCHSLSFGVGGGSRSGKIGCAFQPSD